jgi:hypothetical protein
MANQVESILVTCPRCGEQYGTWQGIGLEVLGPDPCPSCGFTPAQDPRLYRDGPVVEYEEEER